MRGLPIDLSVSENSRVFLYLSVLVNSNSCRKEELLCKKLRDCCYVTPLDKHPNQIEYRPPSVREPAHCWQWHTNCAIHIKVTQQLSTALVNNICFAKIKQCPFCTNLRIPIFRDCVATSAFIFNLGSSRWLLTI